MPLWRRRKRSDGQMTPEASLAEAEAARRAQERKHADEQAVKARLDRIREENDLAARFREAFSQGRHP